VRTTLQLAWPVFNDVYVATKSLEGFSSYAYNWYPTIRRLKAALHARMAPGSAQPLPSIITSDAVRALLDKRINFMVQGATGPVPALSKGQLSALDLAYFLHPGTTPTPELRKQVRTRY
jgi:hypothetical protein